MSRSIDILVAEDDPDDVFLLKRAFSQAGLNDPVHFVRDGQEVVDYLRGAQRADGEPAAGLPNLLLLDLRMPRLDGFEVLRWLKTQPALQRLPVVVLSAVDEPQGIENAYSLGANSYLLKPRNPEALRNLVQTLRRYWGEWNVSADSPAG